MSARTSVLAVLGEGVLPTTCPYSKPLPDPDEDERVDQFHLPCLGAWAQPRDRLLSMALAAADEARMHASSVGPIRFGGRLGVLAVLPPPRADLPAEVLTEIAARIAHEHGAALHERFEAECGTFSALRRAHEWITDGAVEGALLVAADSFVSLAEAERRVAFPPSFWRSDEPALSEGSAALLLLDPRVARSLGVQLARVTSVDTTAGTATERNEEIVDGVPMTGLLWDARAYGPFAHVFGQNFGGLREREWELARSRISGLVTEDASQTTLERELGRLGAAAPAMALAHAVLGMYEGAIEPCGPTLAWAIDDDGLRGLCTLEPQTALSNPHAVGATYVGGNRLQRQRWTPARWPTEHLRPGWEPRISAPTTLRVDTQKGLPAPFPDDLNVRVERLLDAVRVLSHDRMERAYRESASAEIRIVRRLHLLGALGDASREPTCRWWAEQLEVADPHRTWTLVMALGGLEGEGELLGDLLARLPEDAVDDARRGGEALTLLPEPTRATLVDAWRRSPHPVLRGASFVARRRLDPTTPTELDELLARDAHPTLLALALWESAFLNPPPSAQTLDAIEGWLASPQPRIAWYAARAATTHGRPGALHALRHEAASPQKPARLGPILGPMRLELLVLAGGAGDRLLLRQWLRRSTATAHTLDVLARFGDPGAWAYLARHLDDDDLGETAAMSLELLFGRLLPPATRRDAAAWEEAIAACSLVADRRHRLGRPWTPEHFALEVKRGDPSRSDLETRQLELRARIGGGTLRTLEGWADDVAKHLYACGREWTAARSGASGTWAFVV